MLKKRASNPPPLAAIPPLPTSLRSVEEGDSRDTVELNTLIPVNIKVERVGFTRNASNTPYIVYRVGDRRCCTFIKRRFFLELVQILLQLKYGIKNRIRSITSSPDFGLSVRTTTQRQYIRSSYTNKLFERYNQVAVEKTVPQQCNCSDLYDICLHSILRVLHLRIAEYQRNKGSNSALIALQTLCKRTINSVCYA